VPQQSNLQITRTHRCVFNTALPACARFDFNVWLLLLLLLLLLLTADQQGHPPATVLQSP
jgi:hypothetical protein